MSYDVFDFTDYKEFLNNKLDDLDKGGRGSRTRLSKAIGCQTAYTAQVLRGSAQFSLEHGEAVNEFLGHTDEQSHYFLLLLQWAKAGTPSLRKRFQKQIENTQEARLLLKNRLGVNAGIQEHEQVIYYSSWIYGAIHALASIPAFQDPESMADKLGIGLKETQEALAFLQQAGLIEKAKGGTLKIGKGQIHLGSDSPLVTKHHINWRLQAIRALEKNLKENLHYSSVISISKKDATIIREKIVNFIKTIKPIIRESKEEDLCSLSMDFFKI